MQGDTTAGEFFVSVCLPARKVTYSDVVVYLKDDRNTRMILKFLIVLVLLALVGIGLYHTNKPLPPGISYRGQRFRWKNPSC